MNENIFEIVKLVLQIALILITVYIVPSAGKWIKANTTEKQRDNAKFWVAVVVQYIEKEVEKSGQGQFKKSFVLNWLGKNGIEITDEQADVLIDMVVEEFNKNGWDKPIIIE